MLRPDLILLLRRRLLTDEHACEVRSELLPVLIEHAKEPVLFGRLSVMVPLLGVSHDLVLVVRLEGQQ